MGHSWLPFGLSWDSSLNWATPTPAQQPLEELRAEAQP